MSNYGVQNNPYSTSYVEKTYLMSVFIGTIGYGVQLVMYFNCASYFWKQRNCQGKHAYLRLAYITVLLILESLVIGTSTWILISMYIDNRNYPGGPVAWFLASANEPSEVAFWASLFALTFMSDLLVLWRCWVIWSPMGKLAACAVLCGPVLVLLSSLVLGTLWAYQSNRSGLYIYDRVSIYVGTAYVATTLSVNLLVTTLIIIRLLLYRRAVLRVLPAHHTKHYLSVATIVVESVLLYSFFVLGFIITYALDNPMNRVFVYMGSAFQQIAGYLIVLRVAQGRAWTTNTLTLGPVSTNIRFNPPVHTSQGDIELQLVDPYDKNSSTVETKLDIGDAA